MLPLLKTVQTPKQDQASELRRLISAARATAANATMMAVAGATVHSGANRFARMLTAAGDVLPHIEPMRVVSCPPGSAATTSPAFVAAQQRIVVVTPDEVDVMGAFSLLKSANGAGLIDDSLWIVAHRCVGIADQQMILGTLQAVCRRHLGRDLAHLVAVEESRRPGDAITPLELLTQLVAIRPNNRLAAERVERL